MCVCVCGVCVCVDGYLFVSELYDVCDSIFFACVCVCQSVQVCEREFLGFVCVKCDCVFFIVSVFVFVIVHER